MSPEQKIQLLEERIKKLEDRLTSRGVDVELAETIRDVVFFDIDTNTALTQVAVASLVTGNVTVGKIPTKLVGVYYRGQIYDLALYART